MTEALETELYRVLAEYNTDTITFHVGTGVYDYKDTLFMITARDKQTGATINQKLCATTQGAVMFAKEQYRMLPPETP